MIFAPVTAQSIKLKSVEDAVDYALAYNPDLRIYRLNQEKAKQDFEAVRYHRLPVISSSFSGQNNKSLPVTPLPGELFGHPGQTIEAEFGKKYNYNAGITLSKSILDFQARFAAKTAKVGAEIAKANEDVYKQKLSEQTALYYYTAIVTRKALEVQREDFETADSILQLVNQKFQKGITGKYDVNLAKINKNSVQQSIISYEKLLDQCRFNLRLLFGLPTGTDIVFDEKLEINRYNLEPVQKIGLDPELAIYELQLAQSEYKLKQQKSLLLPKFTINSYWGWQQYRDDSGFSWEDNDWSDIRFWSLNISIPIFTGFSTKNKIESAQVGLNLAQITMEREKEKSRIADEHLIKDYNNNIKSLRTVMDSYLIAKENNTLSLQRYEQGLISLINYFDSFEDYLKIESVYLNALSESYTCFATILSRGKKYEK